MNRQLGVYCQSMSRLLKYNLKHNALLSLRSNDSTMVQKFFWIQNVASMLYNFPLFLIPTGT